jgi:hypothetical protein
MQAPSVFQVQRTDRNITPKPSSSKAEPRVSPGASPFNPLRRRLVPGHIPTLDWADDSTVLAVHHGVLVAKRTGTRGGRRIRCSHYGRAKSLSETSL